jgi:hypothetical protein
MRFLIEWIERICVPVQNVAGPFAVMMLVFIIFLKRKELGIILGCVRAILDVERGVGLLVVMVLVGMIRVMSVERVSVLRSGWDTGGLGREC